MGCKTRTNESTPNESGRYKIYVVGQYKTFDKTGLFGKAIAKAIQVWTGCPIFHCGICLPMLNKWIEVDEGRYGDKSRAVWVNTCEGYVNQWFDSDKFRVIEISAPKSYISDYQLTLINDFIYHISSEVNNGEGSAYDWKGIFLAQFIHLGANDSSKYFCSELVAKILAMLGFPPFIVQEPSQYNPCTIFRTLEFYKHLLSEHPVQMSRSEQTMQYNTLGVGALEKKKLVIDSRSSLFREMEGWEIQSIDSNEFVDIIHDVV